MTRGRMFLFVLACLLTAALFISCGGSLPKPPQCKPDEQLVTCVNSQGVPGLCCKPIPTPPTTTTTSTSSTTTTSTTTTTTTSTTVPGPIPTPTPCVTEPLPVGPAVDVRGGFALSSCKDFGENRKCFKDGQGGADVPWEADETSCWPAWVVAEQGGRLPRVLGGVALQCEPGYLSDSDDTARGCFDKYGRRFKWDGSRWVEQSLVAQGRNFSGFWFGICPPRVTTCAPSPGPTPGPTPIPPAGCYTGPWRMHCKWDSCEIKGEPENPAFRDPVVAAIKAVSGANPRFIPEGDALVWARLFRDELKAKGFCSLAEGDPNARVSEDEIAVYSLSNPRLENWDFCVAVGGGQCRIVPEHAFMVARGFP